MEISTFELLFAPIAPKLATHMGLSPDVVTAINDVSRRVAQGYFLTISNLEDKAYTYRLNFKVSLPSPDDQNKRLDGGSPHANNFFVFDLTGVAAPPIMSTVTRVGTSNVYESPLFTIPAGETASVQLLPFVPNFIGENAPDFVVRGYASISLPALRNPRSPFFIAQSSSPVKVLLNPEIRGTLFPNDFTVTPPNFTDQDFAQINYSLALASGKALNEIAPDPSIFLFEEKEAVLAEAK